MAIPSGHESAALFSVWSALSQREFSQTWIKGQTSQHLFFFYQWVFEYKHSSLQSIPAPDLTEKLSCIMNYLSVQIAKMKAYQPLKFLQEFSLYFAYGMEVGNLIGQDSEKEENECDYLSKYVFCFISLLLLHHISFQSFCQCPSSSCHRRVFGVQLFGSTSEVSEDNSIMGIQEFNLSIQIPHSLFRRKLSYSSHQLSIFN